MPSETPFRIALIVVILFTMAVTLYHRLQAAKSGEKISRREEGVLFAVVLRLAGLLLWVATFGYLLFPTYFQWAAMPVPMWLRWIGVVSGALCSLLMWWTLSSLGKNLTDTVVTRAEATLITHGPYRWVRHPFYLTAALLMASVTLLTANWLIGISSVAVLALLAVRTPKEEQMLIEKFGDEYRQYIARTGRFLPRIGG
ncbi:methyltransferase family protein [Lignipirellula cremea]|uniref:Isoprenylcysteine carboxyl methyltransferase (ICMT) family protein n=1 Tax=Lignipirellula cremea TaxID=2528010 RepID=A0A518DQJ4_9BACT|nr:isoprenylcysteine carboxylmethyltransferase family protein [Lignipirellula cremea]QDU94113.1 Isoprenylcysteine carboxyl methyltransferase (ICMT) family protein [Lignipirellula cremea]